MQVPHLLVCLTLSTLACHGAPGFFRAPAIHGDTVVFTAEGDLWKAPVTGGAAQRLTSHPGLESSATLSPDGTQLAFAAQYEGPLETYVMPLAGGLPKRLTWHGEGSLPVGWTRDGKVLCATRAYSTLPNEQLVAIDPATGVDTLLPLAQASDGTYDSNSKRLIFTRLPFQGSSTKRYQGGTAQNLWRFDEGSAEAVPLTADFPGTSKNPMLWKDRIYFLSDRSGVMNLWSMTSDGKDAKALTTHQDFEVRNADLHEGRIVYQQAGSLRLLNLADGANTEIPITLPSDLDQTRDRWVKKPFDFLTRFSLSPDGEKLALTARGSVFIAPVKAGGRFLEIPHSSGVRYREAAFLPDGKSLVAQSDETGEIEMVKLPANGVGKSELLTNDGGIFRFAPLPSPDGKRLAWQDKNLDLWVRDLATKQSVKVSTSPMRGFPDMAWSPDSRWLAFVEPAPNTFTRIRLFHTADGGTIDATGDRVMSTSPAWSADGKWLYFLSDRELKSLVKSPWGPRQPEPFFTESTRIYALSLRKDGRFPFTPPDELSAESPNKEGKNGDEKPAEVVVQGLRRRSAGLGYLARWQVDRPAQERRVPRRRDRRRLPGQARQGRAARCLELRHRSPRGVAADLPRVVADAPRLLLRSQDAWPRLAGHPQEIRAAGRPRGRSFRPQRNPPRDVRRAQRAAHLRPLRRPARRPGLDPALFTRCPLVTRRGERRMEGRARLRQRSRLSRHRQSARPSRRRREGG